MEEHISSASSEYEYPPVTLKDIIRKIIRARWWIIFSSIIILLGTIYVTYSTPPIYEATVSVMIEKSSKAQAIFNFGGNNNYKISDLGRTKFNKIRDDCLDPDTRVILRMQSTE